MRRLGLLDKMVWALLLPIWAVCFGLHVRAVVRPTLFTPVGVRTSERGGYPTLIDIKPGVTREESDLQRGDRLIQIGETDLRGAGALAFYARYVAEAEYGQRLPVIYERSGRRGKTLMPIPVLAAHWPTPFMSLGFVVTALVLSLWAPTSPPVRSTSRAFLLCAIGACPVTGGAALNYAGLALIAVVWPLAFPLCLRAVLLFPSGKAPATAWARIGPWCFAPMGLIGVSFFAGFPVRKELGISLLFLAFVAFFAALLVQAARAYRAADAVGRRQMRWCVLGFAAALSPPITVIALALCDRLFSGSLLRFYSLIAPSFAFTILMPISVLFAVVRYNLFDVDRLLSAAASYNVVLVALLGAGFVAVPRFGELSAQLAGIDPRVGQVVLSLALAAVVVPAHQRLRPRIDRVFFGERYALDQGMADLLRTLSTCEDARTLTESVGEALDRLLQPEACVVYARAGAAFAPVFVSGRAVPPAFEVESPLVATLLERERPLALSASGRRPDAAALGPFDRAALEALEAEVVLPVRRDEALLAFVCLGPKRSGDVYTSTDLTHLASVAEAVSSALRRFDQEEVIRAGRAMQESLRRYVPGAVVDQLASGSELTSGERQVSVLFVDIRGYTSLAETRRSDEIFSIVNRYTETVSKIVRQHGGSVVEFNGDGLMAVFGAPRELARKEIEAVQAGREILSTVGDLPPAGAGSPELSLSVGVGIATGDAFVGNIQAVDRMIWSVLGNTTNLAARLQSLTRELDAAMVVDAATWQALGQAGGDLQLRRGIAIRGRRDVQDVYVL